MTALLYISYSSGLSEEDKVIIDRQVSRNREPVCIVVKTVASNVTDKTARIKKATGIVILAIVLFFSKPNQVKAMGLSLVPKQEVQIEHVNKPVLGRTKLKVASTFAKPVNELFFFPNKEILPVIYLSERNVYINKDILKNLRAGTGLGEALVLGTIFLLVFLTFYYSGVEAFTGPYKLVAPPTVDYGNPYGLPKGGISNSPGYCPAPSTQLAVIPTEAQGFNDMLLRFNELQSKRKFIMSKEEAEEIIAKTYPGRLEVTDTEWISDRQAASHLYHAPGMGINPEDYGWTQKELLNLSEDGGFLAYVREGKTLPPIEFVKDYQQALKNACKMEGIKKRTDTKFYDTNGVKTVTSYSHKEERFIIAFNQETGDFITGDRQREKNFDRFAQTNELGGLKYIYKWNSK